MILTIVLTSLSIATIVYMVALYWFMNKREKRLREQFKKRINPLTGKKMPEELLLSKFTNQSQPVHFPHIGSFINDREF